MTANERPRPDPLDVLDHVSAKTAGTGVLTMHSIRNACKRIQKSGPLAGVRPPTEKEMQALARYWRYINTHKNKNP